MANTTVEAKDLSARFHELVSRAVAGMEIIVTEDSIPRAKLVAMAEDDVDSSALVNEIMADDDEGDPLLESDQEYRRSG